MNKGLPKPTKEIKWYDWEWELPYFGNKPFEVNHEDAYKKGLEIGSKLK